MRNLLDEKVLSEMNKLIVRPYALSDLEKILAIERLSFPKTAYSKAIFNHFFKLCPEGFFVAEVDRKIVGYIIGCEKNGGGEIISMAVDPKFRREGIGGRLLNFILDNFGKKEINALKLHVRTKNRGAIKFYQKFGFQVLKTVKNYYPNGEDTYLMRKVLKKEGEKK